MCAKTDFIILDPDLYCKNCKKWFITENSKRNNKSKAELNKELKSHNI